MTSYFLYSDGPELDGRSLLESILSILISDAWSTCWIIIKELSHLLIHHVLCFHKYLNELREQEWIGKDEFFYDWKGILFVFF